MTLFPLFPLFPHLTVFPHTDTHRDTQTHTDKTGTRETKDKEGETDKASRAVVQNTPKTTDYKTENHTDVTQSHTQSAIHTQNTATHNSTGKNARKTPNLRPKLME